MLKCLSRSCLWLSLFMPSSWYPKLRSHNNIRHPFMEIIVFIMQTVLQKQNIVFDQLKTDVRLLFEFPSLFALGFRLFHQCSRLDYQRPTINNKLHFHWQSSCQVVKHINNGFAYSWCIHLLFNLPPLLFIIRDLSKSIWVWVWVSSIVYLPLWTLPIRHPLDYF